MRKYLKKYANGIYYISEGYNENQMIASGFSNITAGISAGRKMIREIGDSLSDVTPSSRIFRRPASEKSNCF